jgi:hypothetical protein
MLYFVTDKIALLLELNCDVAKKQRAREMIASGKSASETDPKVILMGHEILVLPCP